MASTWLKFTKKSLSAIPFSANQKITKYSDTEFGGLKLKVGKKRKTFFMEKRIRGKGSTSVLMTLGTFPSLPIDDARAQAKHLASLCERGIDPRQKPEAKAESQKTEFITLDRAVRQFFHSKHELRPTSVSTYQTIVRTYLTDWLSKGMEELTLDMLVNKHEEIRRHSRSQAKKTFLVLSSIWNTALILAQQKGESNVPKNLIPEMRSAGVKNKWKPKRNVIPLHKLGLLLETLERLRDAAAKPGTRSTYEVYLLSLMCGFRNTECRTMTWGHVDLVNGLIRLDGANTKNKEDHTVALSSYARNLLTEIHSHRDTMNPFVFPSPRSARKGEYTPICMFAKLNETIVAALGHPFSSHDLRRTFASVGNYLGVPYLNLKRMLNHRYQDDVTEGYVCPDFDPSQFRLEFQKICDFILEKREEYQAKVNDSAG